VTTTQDNLEVKRDFTDSQYYYYFFIIIRHYYHYAAIQNCQIWCSFTGRLLKRKG